MADQAIDREANEGDPVGLLAEFETPQALLAAGRQLRDAGYSRLEAFVPYPVHGLDEALGIRPTRLPWIVLGGGLTGLAVALLLQWYTNAVDYPFIISGKPLFSLPANIPVAFELTILLSAFAAFFGMLAFNGLPRLAQPLLRKPQFLRATNDRFFLLVEARDAAFAQPAAREALAAAGAIGVDDVFDDTRHAALPKWIAPALVTVSILALLPPLWIARARVTQSDKPRWHTFIDMDYQPKFKAQTVSTIFADGRADRLPVSGTVARGSLRVEDPKYRGLAAGTGPIDRSGDVDTLPWTSAIPVEVTQQRVERGRERFNIYCATCHGRAGYGDGLVSQRALELQQGTWVRPSSLHDERARKMPAGQLFDVITHGARKMPGYASQIDVEDRWAIVLYIRALQRSQNARPEDVPAEQLQTMQDF